MKIEKLALAISYNGFLYHQVTRNDKAAIYLQCEKDGKTTAHWEVFKIKTVNYREEMARLAKRFNKAFDPERYAEVKEQFPPDGAFGEWAWTYQSLEAAMKRFEALTLGSEVAP